MQNMPTFSVQTPFSSNTETCSTLRNYYVNEIWLWDGFEQGHLSCCDIDFPVIQLFCAESKVSFCLFFYSIIFKEDMRWVYLFLLLFPVCSVRSSLNPFIVSSTHKVYTRKKPAVQKHTAAQNQAVQECCFADHYVATLNCCICSTTHPVLFIHTSI